MYSDRRTVRRIIRNTLLILLVVLLGIIAVFPLFWLISTSLRQGADVFRPTLFPHPLLLESFTYILRYTPFVGWFLNSLIVSLTATTLALLMSSLAAYSFSRFVTRRKKIMSRAVLLAYMFPGVLLVLPLFVLFVQVGLLDNRFGLILAYATANLPFAMWLLTAYFDTIPKEIDQAARIDGATNNMVFWRLIIPMAAPGLSTAAIFLFINAWNEFLLALILINSNFKMTLPIGLYAQMGGKAGELVEYNIRMASSALVILPMLVVFLALNRYIVRGLTAGALKG
jgi:multiple sugar transport system permease protein